MKKETSAATNRSSFVLLSSSDNKPVLFREREAAPALREMLEARLTAMQRRLLR